jgi:thioredoxin 1
MKSQNITDDNFQSIVLDGGKTVLVDFGAEWCPPCKAMSPLVDQIAEEFEGKAIVGKLDVDSNPQSTAQYGVRNLPTFLIFKNGNLIERIVGAVPKSILRQKVNALL